MLIRRMVRHDINDDPDPALMGLFHQLRKIFHRSVFGLNGRVVRNIVAAITHRRRIERRNPQRIHPQPLQIIEVLNQPTEIPGTAPFRIAEGTQKDFIKDCRAEPFWIGGEARFFGREMQ